MKKAFVLIVSLLLAQAFLFSQQAFTFNRISTDDGLGLASNVVYATYQDPKGFIWIGTANGLQRFDGSKFIQFNLDKQERGSLQVSNLTQIIPAGNDSIWLAFPNRGEFGIFNTSTFKYTIIPIQTTRSIFPGSEYRLWLDSKGETFISVLRAGLLHYDKRKQVFTDDNYFNFPKGWMPTHGVFEDTVKHQYWFACDDKGLAVYDVRSKQLYTSAYNPKKISLLNNKKIVPGTSEIFIDSQRRHWVFNWPGVHIKRCFDSTGKELNDTLGLNLNPDYSEMRNFYETKQGLLWMFGTNALYNYDANERQFYFYEHGAGSPTGIQFHYVYQVMEDHDGSIWIATDNGLYFTSPGSGTFGVVDMLFDTKKGGMEFTDILELKSGGYWLSTWGKGIVTLSKNMMRRGNDIYNNMPAMNGTKWIQYRQAWALYQHTDGKVWIGCQAGNYMVYDTLTHKTKFLSDPALGGSTIKYITGDKKGNIWFATFSGQVVKYDGKKFTMVQEFGSLISKILVDNEGLLWVSPEKRGIYCLSADGTKILQHYTTEGKDNALFVNTGRDIEQLNDSIIVFGAGAMNFINKRTGKVHWLTVADGLPSNTIQRIRIDANGYLWMITLNGLCRYNPSTKRITKYGRKDGITLAHLTVEADYFCSDGFVMFTGANALLYFKPSVFQHTRPPDVRITDFKLLNKYLPVDSLLGLPKLQLTSGQNSFTINYAALSYLQREKLTYYYKMTGIDKDWIKADRRQDINFSLLPPGNYTFSVYCEDIDGTRSQNITSLHIHIKPPFWRHLLVYQLLSFCGGAVHLFHSQFAGEAIISCGKTQEPRGPRPA
jgi:ligand-binding sensor domain-containing protein